MHLKKNKNSIFIQFNTSTLLFSSTSQTFVKVSEDILVILEIWRGLGYFRDFIGIFGHFEVLGYF